MSTAREATAEVWHRFWLQNGNRQGTKNKRKRRKIRKNTTKNQKNICQTTLHGTNLTHKDDDTWGDTETWKHPDVLRIASQNVRGLPPYASGVKNLQLHETIQELHIDILL